MGYLFVMEELKKKKIRDEVQRLMTMETNVYNVLTRHSSKYFAHTTQLILTTAI